MERTGVVAHGNSPTVGLGGGVDQFSERDLNLSPWMRKSFELSGVRDPKPDCRSAQEFFRRRELEARYTRKFGGAQGCEVVPSVSSVVNPLLSSTLCRPAFRGACHLFM